MSTEKLIAYLKGAQATKSAVIPPAKAGARRYYFHAPSVGEYLLAEEIMRSLTAAGHEVILTYTSQSLPDWFKKSRTGPAVNFTYHGFIPLGSRRDMTAWLDKIRPDKVIFVKYDFWKSLIDAANEAGIPVIAISAVMSERSGRFRYLKTRTKKLLSKFTRVYAATEEDRANFTSLFPEVRCEVQGDMGFDMAQSRSTNKLPAFPADFPEKCTLVAGSVWPPDNEILFPVVRKLLIKGVLKKFIVAPHEPKPKYTDEILRYFGEDSVLLSQAGGDTQGKKVLVVDMLGALNLLYQFADVAYVGGAFTTGVHNVIEPCVFGVPCVFGPKFQNSTAAIYLTQNGLAASITDADQLSGAFTDFTAGKEKLSPEILAYFSSGLGVRQKILDALLE